MRLLIAVTLTLFTFNSAGAAGGAAGVRQQPPGQAAAAEDPNELNRRVRELYNAKKFEEAERLAQTAVEAAEHRFGPDSSEAGGALLNLANIQATRHAASKARKTMARAVGLREQHPGALQQSGREALELFTCLDASNMQAKPDVELAKRIHRLLVADSVLAQGSKTPADNAEVKVGEPLSKPPPKYPGRALDARASGAVVLRITIDEAGRVVEASPLDCSAERFIDAASEAARRATFNPTTVGGQPVRVRSLIFYRFVAM